MKPLPFNRKEWQKFRKHQTLVIESKNTPNGLVAKMQVNHSNRFHEILEATS